MKTFLCWLAVGCSLAGVGVSWGGDLPDPPKTYFTDQVGIIPSAAAQSLNAVLVEHARLTSEQVVVVIFKELGDHDLVEYTSSLFQSWRIGKKGKDNGLLLALYWNDHRARMEVGYGLEQLMTDARSQEILDHALIPLLREDQPESALGQTIAEILKTLDSPLVQSGQLDRWFHRGGMRQRALPTVPYAAKWIILFVFFLAVWLMRLLANLRASEHHYTRAGRLRRRGNWWGGDGFGGGGGLGGWGGFGGGGGFSGGGGRSGGGGASGSW